MGGDVGPRVDLSELRRQATILIGYVELLAKHWDASSDQEKRDLLAEAVAAAHDWKALFDEL